MATYKRKHTLMNGTKNKKFCRVISVLVVIAVTVMGCCWMISPSFFFFFNKSGYFSLTHNKPSRNEPSLLDRLEATRHSSYKNYTANEEKDPSSSSSSSEWPYLPANDKSTHVNFWKEGNLRRGPAIDGIDFLWQYNNTSGRGHDASIILPEGILFVAHGCHHSMMDWWPSTSTATTTSASATAGPCPECIGLPEEVAIVDIALKLNLLVVAISSMDRTGSQCWSNNHDGPRVAKVLQGIHGYLVAAARRAVGHDGTTVKILAFGASSGGYFVSTNLPAAMQKNYNTNNTDNKHKNVTHPPHLDGYISQIAASGSTSLSSSAALPVAAVFITMNRDLRTDEKARQETLALQKMGVATRHVRLEPLPLMDDFFSSRINHVNFATSRNMVQALQNADILLLLSSQHDDGNNDRTGNLLFLRQDPRRCDWRSVLAPFAAKIDDSMVADESALSEVLNVAWGMHEMSRDSVQESLEFILQTTAAKSSRKVTHVL